MVFLMTYSESTHKVTSIWTLLGWYHVFRGCCHQDPVFGEKQDFAFREQQNRFRAKLTTGPENSWSKVPPPKRFLVFFFDIRKHTMCATPFYNIQHAHSFSSWRSKSGVVISRLLAISGNCSTESTRRKCARDFFLELNFLCYSKRFIRRTCQKLFRKTDDDFWLRVSPHRN